MDIVKKNLVSIICGVIALIAFVSIFWPLGGYFATLQTTEDTRKSVNDSLNALLLKERKLPIVDPVRVEQQTLHQFPSQQTIEKGREATKQVADVSNAMLSTAIELNRHELLLPGILPAPRDTTKFEFQDKYRRVLNEEIPNQILVAGVPPSLKTIEDEKAKRWENDYKPQIISFNGQSNEQDMKLKFDQDTATLGQQLMIDVAKAKKVYLWPEALVANQAVLGQATPDTDQIWWAQLALWIQLDVAHAIEATNANSKSVVDSPVKHLIKLSIPLAYEQAPTVPAVQGDAPPPPPVTDGSVAITKVFASSPTGRVSNSLFDVVRFDLVVHVEASKIPQFLAELNRNRLITVTNMKLGSVNASEFEANGYYYGTQPVVQLNLECEALFMRKWTEPLMPERIKRAIGLLPPVGPGRP